MTVRFFTLTRINNAIDAGSPFAKVFHDFRKLQTTKRLNPYHLFAKQEKGASLVQIRTKWKTVDPSKKLELKKECADLKEQAEYRFIADHVSDMVYDQKYNTEWTKLRDDVRSNIDRSLDMTIPTNKKFIIECYKARQLMNKVRNPYAIWKKSNPTGTRADYEKITDIERTKLDNQVQKTFKTAITELEKKFPDHELPYFLTESEFTPEYAIKQEKKIWTKLMKEIKLSLDAEMQEKDINKQVMLLFKQQQLIARKKYGFINGSEKKPLNAFMLFSRDQRKDKKFNGVRKVSDVAREIGVMWRNASKNTLKKYDEQAKKNLQIVKVQNNSAVKRVAQCEDWIALTAWEVNLHFDEEVKTKYQKSVKEIKKNIREDIESVDNEEASAA